MQNFISNPCDCSEGYCSHYNTTATGSKYKLLHENSKKGIAFRKAYIKDQIISKNTEELSSFDKLYNLTKSLILFLKSDLKEVTKKTYEARLAVCLLCDKNKKWECSECGCKLQIKAKWASETCPLQKWTRISLQMQEGDSIKSPCGCGS